MMNDIASLISRSVRGRWHTVNPMVPGLCLLGIATLCFNIYVLLSSVLLHYSGFDRGVFWDPARGEVIRVDPTSSAFRDGLRDGDRIITLMSTDHGLEIERMAAPHHLTIRFIPPVLSDYLKRLIPVITALLFSVPAFYFWARHPYNLPAMLLLISTQLGALSVSGERWNLLYPLNAERLLDFGIFTAFAAAAFLHLHIIFPRRNISGRKHVLVACIVYGIAFLLAPIHTYTLFPTNIRHFILHNGDRLFYVLSVLSSIVLLIYAYFKADTSQEHQSVRMVVIGLVLGIIPMIFLVILGEFLTGQPLIMNEIAYAFMIFIPLGYALAIQRHRLLHLARFINRSVVDLFLTIILTLLYAISAAAMPRHWAASMSNQPLLWGILTLGVVAVVVPLRGRVQGLADRLLYGEWYDYHSVTYQMSQQLNGIVELEELVGVLVHRLAALMRLRQVALLLATDPEEITVIEAIGWHKTIAAAPPLSRHCRLVRELLSYALPIDSPTLHRRLLGKEISSNEYYYLSTPEIAVWIPLISHGHLHGLLLLGCRDDAGIPFSREDRRLLSILAQQAAIAAENVLLVETLRIKADELLEMRERLADAREAERLSIAQDLHDGPLQEIYGARMYLKKTSTQLLAHSGTGPIQAQMDRAQQTLQQASDSLRALCGALRPPTLAQFGLCAAIEADVERLQAQHPELIFHLHLMSDDQQLTDRSRLALFRIYQHSVWNAIRHAHARNLRIRLWLDSAHIVLEIADDGCGFQLPTRWIEFVRQNHLGIVGAMERAEAIGGQLEISSERGGGTTVRVTVPYTSAGESGLGENNVADQGAAG